MPDGKLKSFLNSEVFDVVLFWLAVLIAAAGVAVSFGGGYALMLLGFLLLLSVKPLLRWIR